MAAVEPGQIWQWTRPDGRLRTMLVQRIQPGPDQRRAMGINPSTRRRLQCVVAFLEQGRSDARIIETIPNYVWERVQPLPKMVNFRVVW
jgi:hypothetical protein